MTWATEPYATGSTSISMTATTATDESGVEYYFTCTAGGGSETIEETFDTSSDMLIDEDGSSNEVTRVSAGTAYRWGAYNAGSGQNVQLNGCCV